MLNMTAMPLDVFYKTKPDALLIISAIRNHRGKENGKSLVDLIRNPNPINAIEEKSWKPSISMR